jgi:hypothetical protein
MTAMRIACMICLLMGIAVACGSQPATEHTGGLIVTVTAGPTCPVVRENANCAPRPVGQARLRLRGPDDQTLVTDEAGIADAGATAVGTYSLIPQAVHGLMSVPSPRQVVIRRDETTRVVIKYDTGIR